MAHFEFFAHSDIGSRKNQEDAWHVDIQKGLCVLADGMGGHLAGEVASREAINEVCKAATKINSRTSFKLLRENIKQAIELANKRVFFLSQENPSYKGMGTTICCCQTLRKHTVYAHVGDSRIYLLRNGQIKQLTKDHSLINSLSGEELMLKNPLSYKGVITKAVGIAPSIYPSLDWIKTKENDIFLMCTDGLSDFLSKEEISSLIQPENTLEKSVENLVTAAKNAKSQDNITVLMIKIK